MSITARPVALAAGSLFAATAAVDIPHAQPETFTSALDYVLEALFALSLVAGAAAQLVLSRREQPRAARLAWAVAGSGMALAALSALATLAVGHNTLGPAFVLGLPLVVLGGLALAGLDLSRRVSPRYAGMTVAVGTIGMFALGEGFGLLAWSAAWFAIAALLQPAGPRSEPVPAS